MAGSARTGVAANYPGNIFVYKKLFIIVKDGILYFFIGTWGAAGLVVISKRLWRTEELVFEKGRKSLGAAGEWIKAISKSNIMGVVYWFAGT